MHVELKILDSSIYLSDDFPEWKNGLKEDPKSLGGVSVTLNLDCVDGPAVWKKAVDAGATVTMPYEKQFWGDVYGQVKDPYGHEWAIRQMTEAEINPEAHCDAGAKRPKPDEAQVDDKSNSDK
mmetsp:Transcript_10989/g.25033  ORF Transcript_10989/g.25033 Transcript_10989/m.25033 type:complete len:123 (+) Transcript_10989:180-548(+)